MSIGETASDHLSPLRRAGARRSRRLPRFQSAADAARRAGRDRGRLRRRRARPSAADRPHVGAARPRARRSRPSDRRARPHRRRRAGRNHRRRRRTRCSRRRVTEPLGMGVRAIDGLLTCGKGQRVGIFAGSGVGKSTMLGMIARNTTADVNVIALVGERGKEVRDFIERDLGEAGLKRSVVDRRDERSARAGAHQGRLRRDAHRRVLPRRRARRDADDGQRHALRDGAARSRSRDRRADDDARLHALGLRRAAETARTRRHLGNRHDHRALHRAGRRRRHERAGRRRRARDPRRPHRALARARVGQPVSRRSTCWPASAA